MVTIGRCRTDDIADVIAFVEAHWKPGHVFTTHRALLEWQHALPERPGEYSIAVARRTADRAVLGILGYIPTHRFDRSLAANNTVWLALWRVRDDTDTAGLGLRLLTYVTESEPHVTIGVVGFQAAVRPIYRALGFTVGELRHYAMPNPDVDRFELATFSTRTVPATNGRLTATPVDATQFAARVCGLDIGARQAQEPEKTTAFVLERYLRHPFYRYQCDIVERDGVAIGLLVTRVATHAGRSALRIIDYVGPEDAVPDFGPIIQALMRRSGAEYADVHNWGIDPALFRQAGFSEIDLEGPDVVPDHFEPFEARNISIRFAVKAGRPVVLFRGDGDQDRPNWIPA